MYVGIAGTFASGKGEIVRILKRRGFAHYGFGDMLRSELTKQGLDNSIATTTKFANKLRTEHGSGYLAELLFKRMQDETPKHAVFESIRHPSELQTLRRIPGFILICVDAPREERWNRLQSRGRQDNLNSFEEFCYWEDQQLDGKGAEQQLLIVMDQADVKIMNIGDLEELEEQVVEALGL